jgi:RNA polymerase sigma-70 factor (ECF subfamily)
LRSKASGLKNFFFVTSESSYSPTDKRELKVFDNDAAVVEAVKAGDTDAFRQLVDRHKRKLYGVLIRLTGDPDVAEELAQATFVKAYTSLSGFREDATFGTWLVQIGIHGARDHIRRAQRLRDRRVISLDAVREAHGDELDPPDARASSDPSGLVEGREAKALVRQAMAQLPPEYREVLVLKHFEGWPYEQIAVVTGDSEGTLKVRAHRARLLLKERMTDLGWEVAAGG